MLLSDVCLFVAHIGPNWRTDMPINKTKIGPEVAHVTCESDTTFKVKRWKVKVTRPLYSPQPLLPLLGSPPSWLFSSAAFAASPSTAALLHAAVASRCTASVWQSAHFKYRLQWCMHRLHGLTHPTSGAQFTQDCQVVLTSSLMIS